MLTPHSLNVYVLENSQLVKLLKRYTMKKLKRLFLALFSVISVNVSSQTQVYITNTSGPNICDGTASIDSTNMGITSISWYSYDAGTTIQGVYNVTNLCPGNYLLSYIANSIPFAELVTIVYTPCQGYALTSTVTNATNSTTCNGTATVTASGLAPYSYVWSNIGTTTTNTVTNLCPGTYYCEVTDANGCQDEAWIDVLDISQLTGDTLIINGGTGCSPSLGTSTVMFEDCFLDFNSVDTAFISLITSPTNPMDSLMVIWSVLDSTGMSMQNYAVYYPGLGMGCNELQFILYCFQKSSTIHTIVMSSSVSVEISGIDELLGDTKQLIRVSDLMGRETVVQPNQLLIYTYSDGSKEKIFIHE